MKKISHLTRRIVLAVVAVVLVVVMIVANIMLNYYSPIINSFLGGDTADTSSAGSQDAFEYADEVVQEVSAESMVLLKNDDNYLPIKDLDKVNLFGYGSTDYGLLLTGGGSGGTSITDDKSIKVDLTDAFENAGIEYNKTLTEAYEKFSTYDADWRSGGSTGANAVDSLLNPEAGFYTNDLMTQAQNFADTSIVVLSRWGCENGGSNELVNIGSYSNGTFLELTTQEKAMFQALQNRGMEVVVLLNTCNNMELGFLEEYSCIKACLYIGIPGQSGCTVIPKILTGEINPSGRTSDTLPYDYQTNNPVYANAYVSNSNLVYQEGIYFGYKWYETADAEGYFDSVSNTYGDGYDGVVQYPFGYGLSYTDFEWKVTFPKDKNLSADGTYTVSVTVTNKGAYAGKDVVELYGHAPYTEGGIEKAERVLLAFAKTDTIEPTKSTTVELTFTAYDLASYDDYDKNNNGICGYELDSGDYQIYVMRNAHDVVESNSCTMTLQDSIYFETDPVTGNAVGNLFTGDTAYANCPIDGGVTYLSRANNFANFPTTRASVNSPNQNTAATYRYTGYDDKVNDYVYGEDYGIYLVHVENTDADGNVTTSRATADMLSGKDKTATLAYNKDILEDLLDYDSEVWDYILAELTKDDIKNLIGKGGFQTQSLYSIGKPQCLDKDGPAGYNNNVTNPGKSAEYTLFPSEALTGCSWNPSVTYKIGVAQGKIGNASGVNGWYAPGVNLHRSVYNSRNYEYYSEDALLSGTLAEQTIAGAYDNNVYCYLKHFAVSEAGQNPTNVNTWLTEQALRESYLKSFEIAVKGGKATAVMSAFNRVGAVLAGYNHALLTDVLRNEWNFRGSVITDWFSGSGYMSSHTLGVLAGNDLWLCGTADVAANLDLDNDPAVAYAAHVSAKNILYTYVKTNAHAEELNVNQTPHSTLFSVLWIVLNVVLGIGIAVCLLFTFLPSKKKVTPDQSTEQNSHNQS